MSEIRMNKVTASGRISRDLMIVKKSVYFWLDADETSTLLPCVCDGKTAENFKKFCSPGDEITIEGRLISRKFSGGSQVLMVRAEHVSYGRKANTLR